MTTHNSHRRTGRTLAAVAAVPALALTLSACALGSDSSSGGSAANDKGSIGKDFDFSGKTYTVSSKEFTESKILGQVTIDALQAAGAKTKDKTGLVGTPTVRKALTSGSVDMYWDYAGTGWELFLKHDTPYKGTDQAQFEKTAAEDLAKNKVKWLGPAKFGDAYGIALSPNAPAALKNVSTLSDLKPILAKNPKLATFCGASEFFDRQFGEFQKTYGLTFPKKQVTTLQLPAVYTSVAKGKPCNIGEVFTTDARIQTLKLKVLKDDKTAFYTQLASLTTRNDVYTKNPKLQELTKTIGDKLTQDEIIKLNKMVDIDGQTPKAAADAFMKENGFTG